MFDFLVVEYANGEEVDEEEEDVSVLDRLHFQDAGLSPWRYWQELGFYSQSTMTVTSGRKVTYNC